MKNIGIAALAAIAALVLGFGAQLGTQTAQAEVTGSVAVWCGFLGDAGVVCSDGIDDEEVEDIDALIGDDDGELTADDLEDVDLDANQISDMAGYDSIAVFAFVDDDGTVEFAADAGVTVAVSDSGGGFSANADANDETCAGDADDEDCGTTALDEGDGVVVAIVSLGTGDPGDEIDVEISQADDADVSSTETINVVGDPDNLELVAAEAVIGESDDYSDCADEADASDGDQLGDVDKTFLLAIVTDDDDVALTRIGVDLSVDDSDIADVEDDTSVTVDGGDSGIALFAVVCGAEPGVATFTAEEEISGEDADVEVQVVGAPASVALTASPAAINCDGTASSTVSATVTDADGDNVADGTSVNFSVVALGIASPINADTADGVASSTITPLSAGVAGVTVIVTSGSAQASIRVDCNPAAAPTAGPGASPTPPGGIAGPDTGNGGYLGQDSSAGFPMWTLVALTLGAVALAAGGMVTKKVTR